MVREFTELQGTMGGIYARDEGLPEEVWKAIYFHYLPIGVEADAPPTRAQLGKAAVTWAAVSLADKLDTIVGLFAAGEKPTGSRDPYGLRRAAQGVVKILADFSESGRRSMPAGLPELIDQAYRNYDEGRLGAPETWQGPLSEFLVDREAHLLEQRGFRTDEMRAVVPYWWKRPQNAAPSRVGGAGAMRASPTEFAGAGRRCSSASRTSRKGLSTAFGWPTRDCERVLDGAGRSWRCCERSTRRVAGDRGGAGARATIGEAMRRARGVRAGRSIGSSPTCWSWPTTRRFAKARLALLARSAATDSETSRTSRKSCRRAGRLKPDPTLDSPDSTDGALTTRRQRQHAKQKSSREADARPRAATAAKPRKYVYFFGNGKADGNRNMKDLLGGKGSGLAEMTNAGLPVPPGFTISTEVCNIYYQEKAKIPAAIDREIDEHVKKLEKAAGATLGSTEQPAARLGALGREVLDARHDGHDPQPRSERRRRSKGLKRRTQNGRFAFDSYRRFIQMFGNVVLEIPKDAFEHEFEAVKKAQRREARHRSRRDRAARRRRALQGGRAEDGPASRSRRIRASSSRWRATPCSARG